MKKLYVDASGKIKKKKNQLLFLSAKNKIRLFFQIFIGFEVQIEFKYFLKEKLQTREQNMFTNSSIGRFSLEERGQKYCDICAKCRTIGQMPKKFVE